MFGLPVWALKILPYVAVVLVVLGGIYYVYHKGQVDQKNSTASDTLKQVEKDTKNRGKIDTNERKKTDDAATKCLRDPNGC